MNPSDWIALSAFGLTGFSMFCTLIGLAWHWTARIEKRLTIIETSMSFFRERVQLMLSQERLQHDD